MKIWMSFTLIRAILVYLDNNSDRILLSKQTLGDVQSLYYDIGAYDMNYDESKQMCHKAWSEKLIYLCTDMTKKMKANIVYSMKAKPHIMIVFAKVTLFDYHNCCSPKNLEDLQKLNEAVSLANQVKVVRLQDKLVKQNYHHDRNKLLEALIDAIKEISQDKAKTITETSINNDKLLENLNEIFRPNE